MPTFYVEDHPARLGKVVVDEPTESVEAKVITPPEPVAVKTSKAEVK